MIVLKAELKSTNRILNKFLVCLDAAEHNAVPCLLHHPHMHCVDYISRFALKCRQSF